jgi:adenosylmethionine-8-amino-7-oxononanoate aminotransferase
MFRHGATYAGHPTCCAAALANLEILEREQLIPRGRELEGELMDALAPLRDHPACGEIRGGLGLAAAVDLTPEALKTVPGAMARYGSAIREAGVLLRPQATGVAIGPPLTVERSHLDEIASAVRAGLDAVAAAA